MCDALAKCMMFSFPIMDKFLVCVELIKFILNLPYFLFSFQVFLVSCVHEGTQPDCHCFVCFPLFLL
ncbi:hypothetical protein Gohar_006460 [Gossypium harknessii]|uniref:Uncharacterized protein n=1 Tax=Gossypium harknessii TaxID=34285 RepID=A0A7J9GDG6_9ROSI|nr:hypothetical protein [Gossypium harknessii]